MDRRLREEGHRLNVSGVLRVLGVSRSGYNAWRTRTPSAREQKKNSIKEKIYRIYEDSHQNYGAPKITEILRSSGETISEKTVGSYMREMGIRAQWVKPYTVTTINPDFSTEYRNLLDRKFNPGKPDAVWCSDITYIWTSEGFVYLTSIMDLFSRKIISWVLSGSLETRHVTEAVEKAKRQRDVKTPLVLHSDRGTQYTSNEYRQTAEGMACSYSAKACPWDNACIESFHALLKREWIYRFRIHDYNHAYRLVFEYIEAFYNTVRVHSHCGYISPDKYEDNYWKELRKMEINAA